MVHHGVEWIVASRSEAGRFFGQNLHTQKQADLVLVDSTRAGRWTHPSSGRTLILFALSGEPTATGKAPRWLLSARDLLDGRFYQSISLRGLAREAGVHPVH